MKQGNKKTFTLHFCYGIQTRFFFIFLDGQWWRYEHSLVQVQYSFNHWNIPITEIFICKEFQAQFVSTVTHYGLNKNPRDIENSNH